MEASCSGSKEFDETRESTESLKNESEKLGNPHCEHIHVRDVLARISYIGKSSLLHLVWYQTSHMSHWSLTNSRGSRVAGPMLRSRFQCRGRGSKVAVAGPRSRSRVQCRGRGSKVAVAGPMSRQGKMIWKRLIWKQYEGKKSFLCTILYGSQFTGYGC